MKLLVVSHSPLYKMGSEYFAYDTWIKFPIDLSRHFEKLTLVVQVKLVNNGIVPQNSWKVDLANVRVEDSDIFGDFVSYFKLLPTRYFRWKRQIDNLVNHHDVVLFRYPNVGVGFVSKATQRFRKPFIMMINGDIEKIDRVIGNKGLKKLFYKFVTKCLVYSEKKCAQKATVVYAYSRILAERHRRCGADIRLRMDSHLRKDNVVFRQDTCQLDEIKLLRICWVTPLKGLECLLKAMASLVRKGLKLKLEIVGSERNLDYRLELESLAKRLGLTDKVVFSAWIPFEKIWEAYDRNDIQIVSSITEGFPRCIVEGAARGLPLVSTTAGGIPDVMLHEHNALLVPIEDPLAMSLAIERMVLDHNLRKKIIRNGYRLAEGATFETLGIKYVDEIKNLVMKEAAKSTYEKNINKENNSKEKRL